MFILREWFAIDFIRIRSPVGMHEATLSCYAHEHRPVHSKTSGAGKYLALNGKDSG